MGMAATKKSAGGSLLARPLFKVLGHLEQEASELYYWNPRKELPYQSRACKIPHTWNMAPSVSEQTQEQLLSICPYKDRTQLPSRAAPGLCLS